MKVKQLHRFQRKQMFKKEPLFYMLIITVMCFSFSFFLASGPTTAVGQGINNASKNIVSEIASVYCGSLAFLFFAIDICVLALCKNEKVIGAAKIGLIAIPIAYVVLKMAAAGTGGSLGQTMENISNWATGSQSA